MKTPIFFKFFFTLFKYILNHLQLNNKMKQSITESTAFNFRKLGIGLQLFQFFSIFVFNFFSKSFIPSSEKSIATIL